MRRVLGILCFFLTTNAEADVENYLPVNLKCPNENKGRLELLQQNGRGDLERMRVLFKKTDPKAPTFISLEQKPAGGSYRVAKEYDFAKGIDKSEEFQAEKAASLAQRYQKICVSKGARRGLDLELRANRDSLKNKTLAEEAPSEPEDGGGGSGSDIMPVN